MSDTVRPPLLLNVELAYGDSLQLGPSGNEGKTLRLHAEGWTEAVFACLVYHLDEDQVRAVRDYCTALLGEEAP